jgi:hypothetical protein
VAEVVVETTTTLIPSTTTTVVVIPEEIPEMDPPEPVVETPQLTG